MKKIITLLLSCVLLTGINISAANLYLIGNTSSTWTTSSVSGFTVFKVDLSHSGTNGSTAVTLTQWLNDRNSATPTYLINGVAGSTFATADQVWIAGGTYNVAIAWTVLSAAGTPTPGNIYGGFAGSENTVNERIKGASAWNFTNETIINSLTSTTGAIAAGGDRTITFDGITFNGFGTTQAFQQRGNMNIQNCKFTSNTAAAIVFYNGTKNASVINSYFYNNSYSTGSNAACINLNTSTGTVVYTVNGCVFESNSNASTNSGTSAGIKTQGAGTYNISNCIFKNNKATGGSSSAVSFTVANSNLTNCLIYGNVADAGTLPGLYMTAGNAFNCSFLNTYKGVYINSTGAINLTNCVFWGTLAASGQINSGGTTSNINLNNCAYISVGTVNTNNNAVVLPAANTGTSGSPNFADPDNNIWSLAAGSSLLDKGTSTNAPATDFNGLTRSGQGSNYDIGAFEAIQANVNISDITSLTPNSDISVLNSGLLTINSNKKINSLSVGIGGKATLSSGNTLECNKMIIASNASGAGTFVDNGGTLNATTATAQQQLAAARNWYMSSPVSGATGLPTVNSGSVVFYSYPENDAAQATGGSGFAAGGVWNTVDAGSFVTGKGYIVKPGDVNATVSFTGTSFNTGDKIISALTNTTDNPKHGFNLIGNPYPSYVNVLPSVTANANLEPTVWYRTRDTNETPLYHFETVNATSGVGTNAAGTGRVTGFIPPMQGFWVRTNADGESITLLNANRSHATSVSMTDIGVVPTTGLKAPAAVKSDFSLLGLYVTNGSTGDETILMFAPGASNDQDVYDSQKISNNNASIPEIYTLAGKVQLAINGMRNFSETEIPLGFTTGTAGNFTIKTSELRNFDSNTRIWLLDKQENKQTELTPETEYTFSSTATTGNESRFSLLFRAPGATTGNVNAESNQVSVFVNAQNGIVINAVEGSRYSVYNTAGQQMAAGKTGSAFETINQQLNNGVYVVRVGSVSKRVIVK